MCRITYNNKIAYLSSYVQLDKSNENKFDVNKERIKIEKCKNIKIEIEIPDEVYNKATKIYQVFNKSLKEVLDKVCNDYITDTLNDINALL